jgi:hypothetical protein
VSEPTAIPTRPETLKSKPKWTLNPKHPERICWGCDKYCSADDLRCGNGTIRTQHPAELFGDDWLEWGIDVNAQSKVDDAQRTGANELPAKR